MTTLKDFLPHLRDCYRSIDIEVLAVNDGTGKFLNIATKIVFSDREFKQKPPDIRPEGDLILIKERLPFEKYESVSAALKNRNLTLANKEILFLWDFDIEQHPNWSFDKYCVDGYGWPTFSGSLSGDVLSHSDVHLREILITLKMKHESAIKNMGCGSLEDLIRRELKIYDIGRDYHHFVNVVCPIYAKIGNLSVTKNKIVISGTTHSALYPLRVLGKYLKEHHDAPQGFFDFDVPAHKDVTSHFSKKLPINLDEIKELVVSLELVHKKTGKTVYDINRVSIKNLLMENNVYPSPLYAALEQFIHNEEMTKILNELSASKNYDQKIGIEDVFEETVAQILNAGGIPTIRLGKYEELKKRVSEKKAINIGSADLLSYDSKNRILCVIGCKSGIPDKPFIDKINETAHRLKKLINSEVRPVIFTNATKINETKAIAEGSDVIHVNSEGLKELLDLVKVRQITLKDLIKEEHSAIKASLHLMRTVKNHELE